MPLSMSIRSSVHLPVSVTVSDRQPDRQVQIGTVTGWPILSASTYYIRIKHMVQKIGRNLIYNLLTSFHIKTISKMRCYIKNRGKNGSIQTTFNSIYLWLTVGGNIAKILSCALKICTNEHIDLFGYCSFITFSPMPKGDAFV